MTQKNQLEINIYGASKSSGSDVVCPLLSSVLFSSLRFTVLCFCKVLNNSEDFDRVRFLAPRNLRASFFCHGLAMTSHTTTQTKRKKNGYYRPQQQDPRPRQKQEKSSLPLPLSLSLNAFLCYNQTQINTLPTNSTSNSRRSNTTTTTINNKMPHAQAEKIKGEGNVFFKGGQYAEAIAKYNEATAIDPNVPSYWSNMAACHEKLNQYEEMAVAGRSCIKADKNFVKGYFRLAVAYKALDDLNQCIKTLENGLAIQSSNADLKRMKKEVTELQRGEQVAIYCGKAEEMMQNGDITGAMKQLDFASRLDAGNTDIVRMMSKVQPKYDAMERKRKATLSPVEKYKEQGDAKYKNANFEDAIEYYSKCLNQLQNESKSGSDLALKAYANRAACYKQISNFDGVISDCTAVLEVDPDNVKALIRRAQAFEGVERYRFALQDVKTVLMMGISSVGKTNYDLCNMMQHRLQRTVNQLKKMNSS